MALERFQHVVKRKMSVWEVGMGRDGTGCRCRLFAAGTGWV